MPAWSQAARGLARSEVGKKVIGAAAAAAGAAIANGAPQIPAKVQGARRQRQLAYALARQVHGQLTESVFVGSLHTHLVVWKDGKPLAAYPPVDGDLATREELRHVVDADRFDPPPPRRQWRQT